MSMKVRVLCVIALSGCSLNVPVLGPSVTEDHDMTLSSSELTRLEPASLKEEQDWPDMFEHGQPREKLDHSTDIEFYKWAALKGYSKAYVVLADTYLSAQPKNEAEALYWLNKGVSVNDIPCMMRLAQYYALEKKNTNLPEAEKLLAPLIEEDYIPAIRLAALIAESNLETAKQISYLNKARQLGDLDSAHRLEQFVSVDKPYESAFNLNSSDQEDYHELGDLKGFWEEAQSTVKKPRQTGAFDSMTQQSVGVDRQLNELLEIASSQSSQYASFILANQIFNTAFKSKEDGQSLKNLLESSLSIPAAKSLYARALFQGKIIDSDKDPISLLLQAADKEDPYALFYLSLHYRFTEKDYAQATQYYYKGLAADSSLIGQYKVALDLLNEYYPMSSAKTAHEWMVDLAYKSFPPALLKVAELKENKKILSQSKREIFMHRAKAAYLGSPEACYQVGNMYLKGEAVKSDAKRAFLWFMHSARSGYLPAQYQLSLMYKKGLGVLENPVKSYAWYSLLPPIFEAQDLIKEDFIEAMSHQQLAQGLEMSEILKKYYQTNQAVFS